MAPPRFQHLQAAVGGPSPQAFPEEEAPTNKVQQMLGRVETKKRTIPVVGGVHEHHDANSHVDHAVKRAPTTTQLGLAPVFEVLPEDEQGQEETARTPRKPTPPPPPPASRKPAPAPMFHEDESFEPELARMLEGPTTLLAPAPASHGMPAWTRRSTKRWPKTRMP
jgi:hypothetical protein